jgi:hypothetical protein
MFAVYMYGRHADAGVYLIGLYYHYNFSIFAMVLKMVNDWLEVTQDYGRVAPAERLCQ